MIIGNEDYEDLGNHSTEAMGETGLFSITQVRIRHNLVRKYILCLNLTPYPSSGHAHDEGIDGTVSLPRDGAWTCP